MTNANLILYTLLASAAVVGAVFVVISRTATRGALGLGVVALAAAGLVGAFANAPLVAVALVLLQGSVIAAVYLVGLMIQPIRADSSTPGSEHTADHALEPVPSSAGRWLGLSAVAVVVVVLGIIVFETNHNPNQAIQQAGLASADSLTAAAPAVAADVESLTDLLSRRHLVSFSVIGFVLLAATLALVESNRADFLADS